MDIYNNYNNNSSKNMAHHLHFSAECSPLQTRRSIHRKCSRKKNCWRNQRIWFLSIHAIMIIVITIIILSMWSVIEAIVWFFTLAGICFCLQKRNSMLLNMQHATDENMNSLKTPKYSKITLLVSQSVLQAVEVTTDTYTRFICVISIFNPPLSFRKIPYGLQVSGVNPNGA